MKKYLLAYLFSFTIFIGMTQTKILLSVNEKSLTAILIENEATRELIELLEKGPIDIEMNDYGGFEKVGELPQSFPTSNRQITTEPGDIMLYQGSNMVIFYGSNSWSYTPLGKIEESSISKLKDFLGEGNINLRLSLVASDDVEIVASENSLTSDSVFDLQGNLVSRRPLDCGVYIINGKKTLVKTR